MAAKMLRLKKPKAGRGIERLLALAVYGDLFDEKAAGTIRKQLRGLANIDEDEDDDDEEDDEEEKLNKAAWIMYHTLFTRVTAGKAAAAQNTAAANVLKKE